ncbi:MAG: ABC transporter permease [Sphingobacteriia bacterium]|nr:ABC transporter permease [Sphingobacteriia bacterium]
MISGISVAGVTVGTMALIIVLSVFNGFESLIVSLFNSFNPDLIITVKKGKTFDLTTFPLSDIKKLPGVYAVTEVVEENALLKYRSNQYLATIKGVSQDYEKTSGLDTMLVEGSFNLYEYNQPRMIMGAGIAYYLNASLQDQLYPITIYLPRREGAVTMSLERAFNSKNLFPSAVFSIQQDFDSKYAIVPLDFVRELMNYKNEVTALELKISEGYHVEDIKTKIKSIVGTNFEVKNRFEQQALLYKVMKSEKWAIFFILTFILIIAAFNVISSLTMLILDKKQDIAILHSMGANNRLIKKIFLFEGMLISIGGAILGLVFGGLVSWIQQKFEIIRLGGESGAFVITAYPVELQIFDFLIVFFTVIVIGWIVAWYPVHQISKKYLLYQY